MTRLVVALVLSLTACVQASASEAVLLDEFSIELPVVEPGQTELRVRNAGDFPHTLVISDAGGQVIIATETIDPGSQLTVPVDLDAGRYQFSCRIVVETPSGAISDHFELGMVAEVELET